MIKVGRPTLLAVNRYPTWRYGVKGWCMVDATEPVRPNPPPVPRSIKTWQDGEVNAAAWMKFMGWHDATVTPSGPDAGIDVQATGAVAQVKARVGKAERRDLQSLRGAAHMGQDVCLFFAMGGFSAQAVTYADEVSMALFTYGFDGSVEASNGVGATLLSRAAGLPAPRSQLSATASAFVFCCILLVIGVVMLKLGASGGIAGGIAFVLVVFGGLGAVGVLMPDSPKKKPRRR